MSRSHTYTLGSTSEQSWGEKVHKFLHGRPDCRCADCGHALPAPSPHRTRWCCSCACGVAAGWSWGWCLVSQAHPKPAVGNNTVTSQPPVTTNPVSTAPATTSSPPDPGSTTTTTTNSGPSWLALSQTALGASVDADLANTLYNLRVGGQYRITFSEPGRPGCLLDYGSPRRPYRRRPCPPTISARRMPSW